MSKPIDLIGKKFGRLTVIERLENNSRGGTVWNCQCDCGNIKIADGERLRLGKVKSCGCLLMDVARVKNFKHGLHGSKIYNVWKGMKQRCYYKNHIEYPDYGARGIIVCEEWLNDFQSFYDWSMKNGYKDGLTIDRINTNGNYEPSNCRWVTQKVQSNNKRSSLFVIYKGKRMTVKELSEETGKGYAFLRSHYHKGDLQRVVPGSRILVDDEVEV